jgi:hypothetical protein
MGVGHVVLETVRVLVSLSTPSNRTPMRPFHILRGRVVSVFFVVFEAVGVLVSLATSRNLANVRPISLVAVVMMVVV